MKSKNLLHSSLGFWQNHTEIANQERSKPLSTYYQSWNNKRINTRRINVSNSKLNDYSSKKEYYTIFISDKIFFRILFSIAVTTILVSAISLISYPYWMINHVPKKESSAVDMIKSNQ